MRAKKMVAARRRPRVSRVPPLNVREYSGVKWIWTSDAVYQLHWRNAGRVPIVRIFSDHKGGRILLVEGSRQKPMVFRGKNSEKRAFSEGTGIVMMTTLRG